MDAAQLASVETFMGIAGCDKEFAASFLEAYGWSLEMAVNNFMDPGASGGATMGGGASSLGADPGGAGMGGGGGGAAFDAMGASSSLGGVAMEAPPLALDDDALAELDAPPASLEAEEPQRADVLNALFADDFAIDDDGLFDV